VSTPIRRTLLTATAALTLALLGAGAALAHHLFNWAPPTNLSVGAGTSGVVTGDFDGDGDTDIAAIATNGGAAGTGRVALSRGNGAGAFTPFADVFTGGAPVALDAGHLNGDGVLDLVVANSVGRSSALVPAAVDFGRRILAAGPSAGAHFTLTNGGQAAVVTGVAITGVAAGEFAIAGSTCAGPLAPNAACGVVIRFDPSTTGTKSATLEIRTDGATFTAALTGRSGSPSAALAPIGTNFGGRVVGGGGSAPTVFTFTNRGGARTVTNVSITGSAASQFTLVDDDCTGKLLAVNAMCEVVVRFAPSSNGVKTAALGLATNPSLAGLSSTLTGAGSAGEVAALLNDGAGNFSMTASLAMDVPTDVEVDKLDRDNYLDIIASSVDGDSVIVWPGHNDGRFGAPVVTSVSNPSGIALGNVNSGSARDVVVTSADDDLVRVLIGNRTGRFTAGATYAANEPRSAFVVYKINKDNFRDLVYTEYGANEVSYRLGAGDGTFGAKSSFPVNTPTSVLVGDVSNQAEDILVTDESGNRVSIMLGCGGSIVPGVCVVPGAAFDPPTHWQVGAGPRDIAIGNFDNALSLDMVVANFAGGDVTIRLNATPCPGGGGCD
jgi:hypothetical protein